MKKLFFAFFIAAVALIGVCSCSKKSDSSFSFVEFHNKNTTTYVNDEDDNDINIHSWTIPTSVVTDYTEESTTTTVKITAYVAGANETGTRVTNNRQSGVTKYYVDTTQTKNNNYITTTQIASVSNNNRTNQNIVTTRKAETNTKIETTVKTTAPKKTITTTATTTQTPPKKTTETAYKIKYVPSLYVETSDEETYTPNEIIAEVFKSSATMWFENEEDLKKVADVLKSLDCYKLQKNGTFNFNDYLAKKGIEEDQLKYLVSVLIYESSKTSSVKIDENTFPEYNSYDADTNVSSSNGNLILTANDNIVFYVYVNSYSYSITLSQYITY